MLCLSPPRLYKFRIQIITLILSYTVVVFRREPKANVMEALALARALTKAPSGLPRYKKKNCQCKNCEMLKLTNNLNGIISFKRQINNSCTHVNRYVWLRAIIFKWKFLPIHYNKLNNNNICNLLDIVRKVHINNTWLL